MKFFDTLALDGSMRRTADGYLVASALVARTGIQIYAGREVGRPDLHSVRVFRPADEVFSKDSMASYAHKPVTNDHPADAVDAANWRKLAVGNVGDEVARDGEMIRVPLVIMDGATIGDVTAGKRELSMGYTCDLAWESGETADGLKFDAIQRNIRANHLAVVDKARGGPDLRIGDDMPEIALKTIQVDGLPFKVNDEAETIIAKLQRDLEGAKKSLSDAQAASATAATASAATLATKDAEIATLKSQILDEAAIDSRVKEKETVVATAKKIVGDSFKVEAGVSVADIYKAVVSSVVGDAAKAFTVEQFKASFDTLAGMKAKAAPGSDPLRAAIQNGGGTMTDAMTARQKAIEAGREAWKTPASVAKQ